MKQLMGNGFKRREFSLGLASKCIPHLRPALTPLRDPFHLPTAPCMGTAAAGTPGALPGSSQGSLAQAHPSPGVGTRYESRGTNSRPPAPQ